MAHGYYQNKAGLQKRLSRIEGQVRGVSRMVESDTYCIDILTQVSALRAAIDKVSLELIRDHAEHCLSNSKDDSKQKADELATAIGRIL